MYLQVPLADAPLLSIISSIRIDTENLFKCLSKYLREDKFSKIAEFCIKLISVLLDILTEMDDNDAKFFGMEVFLADVKKLYQGPVEKIKLATNNFGSGLSQKDFTLLLDLLNELKALTYVRKPFGSQDVENLTEYISLNSQPVINYLLPNLKDYLEVGQALKDDVITQQFISEIEKLHLDGYEVSPFMSIVGPSYMGKTQMAFTLSHKLCVIYVNFPLSFREYFQPQPIYSLFYGLARIFGDCIRKDTLTPKFKSTYGNAEKIRDFFARPLHTLGLLYVLFQSHEMHGDKGIYEWLSEIVKIDQIMIPRLTIFDFQSKFSDLRKKVVFIDGLTLANDEASLIKTKFLRNLCRAIRLPCILSCTNTHINNLTGRPSRVVSHSRMGNNQIPWVQVMVKTPKATLNSFSKLVKIETYEDNRGTLEDQLKSLKVDRENLEDNCRTLWDYLRDNYLDYDRIFIDFYGQNGDLSKFEPIKKLIQFLISQSSTSLPGIITMILNNLFRLLPIHKDDPAKFWVDLVSETMNLIKTQKISMVFFTGLLASAQILVFESSSLKKGIEDGKYSASLVAKHLFHYGAENDIYFRLNVRIDNEIGTIELVRNGTTFRDKCNFPELEDDFFTAFLCLSMWRFSEFTQTGSDYGIFTLAGIYQEYLDKGGFKIGVNRNIPNSLSLEILAHWSICFASHQNLNGQNGGKDVFTKFAQQLQSFRKKDGPVAFSGLTDIPASLEGIFSRVKVPYLMKFPQNDFKQTLEQYLGDFIKFGESKTVPDSVGKDIAFDLEFDGIPRKGFVECKLWAENIGSPQIYEYYKRACLGNYPLSFLVCKKIIEKVDFSPKETKNPPKPQARSKRSKISQSKKRAEKTEREKTDYGALCKELWDSDEGNHIDIYTVRYEATKIIGVIDAKFTVEKVKSFENPKGAFIVIESSFNPPNLGTVS